MASPQARRGPKADNHGLAGLPGPSCPAPPGRATALPAIAPTPPRADMPVPAKPLTAWRPFWAKRLGTAPFLPMSRAEMEALGWDSCDVIIVTGCLLYTSRCV